MNRASAFLICLLVCGMALLPVSAKAEEIYLQDGWQASVTNVQLLMGSYGPEDWGFWGWESHVPGDWTKDSSHITIQRDSGWESTDMVTFNMTNGWVTVGQQDAYVTTILALSNFYHAIQFDWETNWTSQDAGEYLRFEVWGAEIEGQLPMGPYRMLWALYPGPGVKSGHATVWPVSPGGGFGFLQLHLAANPVPEPSSLLALFSGLAGLGGLYWKRKR